MDNSFYDKFTSSCKFGESTTNDSKNVKAEAPDNGFYDIMS
jgi:hypothetical protein